MTTADVIDRPTLEDALGVSKRTLADFLGGLSVHSHPHLVARDGAGRTPSLYFRVAIIDEWRQRSTSNGGRRRVFHGIPEHLRTEFERVSTHLRVNEQVQWLARRGVRVSRATLYREAGESKVSTE